MLKRYSQLQVVWQRFPYAKSPYRRLQKFPIFFPMHQVCSLNWQFPLQWYSDKFQLNSKRRRQRRRRRYIECTWTSTRVISSMCVRKASEPRRALLPEKQRRAVSPVRQLNEFAPCLVMERACKSEGPLVLSTVYSANTRVPKHRRRRIKRGEPKYKETEEKRVKNAVVATRCSRSITGEALMLSHAKHTSRLNSSRKFFCAMISRFYSTFSLNLDTVVLCNGKN